MKSEVKIKSSGATKEVAFDFAGRPMQASIVERIILAFLSAPPKAVYRIRMTVRVSFIPVTQSIWASNGRPG